MEEIKVIIGLNYGDEGKGFTTHYFSQEAGHYGYSVLNVLHNGGVQRGHTANGHVYHCFGAGTCDGAATYYHQNFIVDPIGWEIEAARLNYPMLFVNPDCRITIPYDIAINQIIERKRGDGRHGSCGMGIYEARLRSESYPFNFYQANDVFQVYNYLRHIRDAYLPIRCKELGIDEEEVIGFVDIDRYIKTLFKMQTYVAISGPSIYHNYNTIIYEGGQGLLLDEDNLDDFPHLTPSHTGSTVISREINRFPEDVEVEVAYVTRPYATRHGAGPMFFECDKSRINEYIQDTTNVPNQFQGNLRYGFLDYDGVRDRIKKDLSFYKRPLTSSVVYTRLYDTDGLIFTRSKKDSRNHLITPSKEFAGTDKMYVFWDTNI